MLTGSARFRRTSGTMVKSRLAFIPAVAVTLRYRKQYKSKDMKTNYRFNGSILQISYICVDIINEY